MSLVSDTILTERDVKKRAAALKFFIKLAVRAPESVLLTSDSDRLSSCLQNFSAAFAVVGSLNGSSITRLKKTWEVSLCERMRSR
jgi:son of sevenless-like protein